MREKSFIPADYDVFAGLDVDKRSIAVTFIDHQGFIKSLRMRLDPRATDCMMAWWRKPTRA